MIEVQLFAKRKPNDRHWYAYDVLLKGETIVSNSRDPEHDLARALLARGISGVIQLLDGGTGKRRSMVNIERAAPRGIGSNLDPYEWKPGEMGKDSPPAGKVVARGILVGEAA